VRMLLSPKPARMLSICPPSDRLMNRIRQPLTSSGLAKRWTTSGWPSEAAEGIVAQDADAEGLIGAGEGAGRPLDELGEVEKEDGLDLVFLGNRRLGAPGQRIRRKNQQQDKSNSDFPSRTEEFQNFNATFP
jgi:hypothetical protein